MIVNDDTENNDKYYRLLFNKASIVFFIIKYYIYLLVTY